jgi:ubiquinone/menaquinone biosynthesis C-methylase UbiE
MSGDTDETRDFWNRVADDWQIQVGNEGDRNRFLNSDPVLWRFAGDVRGLDVLDAGCGTGYLSRQLYERGARVVGVDFSERMIEIARNRSSDVDFRVDFCAELQSLGDGQFDLLVSNYVLMDVRDLDAAMRAFARVLKAGGCAVLIFSHPCFPQGIARIGEGCREIQYVWTFPYFEQSQRVDPPWAHFKSEFIWFHRPLSDYWKAFAAAGFDVVDFDEPRIAEERYHLATRENALINYKSRPYSVAFKLLRR